jgi:hypothetical protein
MQSSLYNANRIIKMLIKYSLTIDEKFYRAIYDCLVAGDPKQRTLRGLITNITSSYAKVNDMGRKRGKNVK